MARNWIMDFSGGLTDLNNTQEIVAILDGLQLARKLLLSLLGGSIQDSYVILEVDA